MKCSVRLPSLIGLCLAGLALCAPFRVTQAQAQFAGVYDGQVFFKTITQGIESPEIPQGDVRLEVDSLGNLESQGVAVLTGRVDAGGNITFNPNGFFFQTGQIANDQMTAVGTLETVGNTLIYRLAADLADAPPVITQQPESQTVPAGGAVTFTVTASGEVTYQWQKDGVDLPGATGASLTLSDLTEQDAGVYRVRVTNAVGTVTSAAATLTVTVAVENPTWREALFRQLVDTRTPVPDEDGTFQSFGGSYLTSDAVYFVHLKDFDGVGLYRYDANGLGTIANRAGVSPVDGVNFSRFRLATGSPGPAPGTVLFYAESITFGLYEWRAGNVTTLLDATASLPDAPDQLLGSIDSPIYAQGRMLFRGSDQGPLVDHQNLYYLEGETLTLAASVDDLVIDDPAVQGPFAFTVPGGASQPLGSMDFDGDSFAVQAASFDGSGYTALLASFDGGPLVRIADTKTVAPRDVRADQIAGAGPSGRGVGLFRRPGDSIQGNVHPAWERLHAGDADQS